MTCSDCKKSTSGDCGKHHAVESKPIKSTGVSCPQCSLLDTGIHPMTRIMSVTGNESDILQCPSCKTVISL